MHASVQQGHFAELHVNRPSPTAGAAAHLGHAQPDVVVNLHDVLLHVAGETSGGIIVRGAKFETAAPYANQAFVKPTIGDWGDAELSDYAVGFVADMAAPGI